MSVAFARRSSVRKCLRRASLTGLLAASFALSSCSERRVERALVDALEAARLEAGAPGAILGVQLADRPPVVVAAGHLDMAGEQRIEVDQPYYLGSITKTYTASVVLRLAEDALLSLDDRLGRWIPDFPRGDEISIRQLLAQTTGLEDFYNDLYFRPDRDEMIELVTRSWTQDELLELAGRFGHRFEPGSDWAYSNTNYYLLGVVIERASGLTLADAYRHYVTAPLELERTWLASHEAPRGSLPTGYMGALSAWPHSQMFGALGPTTRLDESPVEWGAGGLVAPAGDALRFLGNLMRGRLLSESSLEAMMTFTPTPALGIPAHSDAVSESGNGYGLGLVKMERGGRALIGHGGLFTGHTAGSWYVPECDATVAIYLNRGFVGQRDLLDRALELMVPARSEERRSGGL